MALILAIWLWCTINNSTLNTNRKLMLYISWKVSTKYVEKIHIFLWSIIMKEMNKVHLYAKRENKTNLNKFTHKNVPWQSRGSSLCRWHVGSGTRGWHWIWPHSIHWGQSHLKMSEIDDSCIKSMKRCWKN